MTTAEMIVARQMLAALKEANRWCLPLNAARIVGLAIETAEASGITTAPPHDPYGDANIAAEIASFRIGR